MKKLIFTLYGILLCLFLSAQCSITVNKSEACLNTPYTLFAQFTGINDSIVWDFGNDKQYCSPVDYTFTSTGSQNVTLRLYRNGSVFCTSQISVNVNPLPIPDFIVKGDVQQCYNENAYTFVNKSTHSTTTPIVAKTFFFGDSSAQTLTTRDSIVKNYILKQRNKYTVGIGVEDAKGCFATKFIDSAIEVFADLGASFTSPYKESCASTSVTLTNNSLAQQSDVAKFTWLLGDSITTNTTTWNNLNYTFTKSGCFSPVLILEDNNGCIDSFTRNIACNSVQRPVIKLPQGRRVVNYGEVVEFQTDFIPFVSYNWNFGDVRSGMLNNSDLLAPSHKFSGLGPHIVRLAVKEKNCFFDTSIIIHVKGPFTLIEVRWSPSGVVAPSQRYQCSIEDTVFFVNNSSYYLNDSEPLNDVGYSFLDYTVFFNTAKQLIIKDIGSGNDVYDTLNLNNTPINTTLKGGKPLFISANADTIRVDASSLYFNKQELVYSQIQTFGITAKILTENTKNDEVVRVWDFDDLQAPQCTTDSRPIYPKLAQYNNLHFSGTLAPRNTYNSNGNWVNCNFSHDSLPKHKYSKGFEDNYMVKLYITDTSGKDSAIINLSASRNDPTYPDSSSTRVDSLALALLPPKASGVEFHGIPCYGPPNIYGFVIDFTKTQPNYDRQFFWIHLDSARDKNDATPNTFDKWLPQTRTVIDRLLTPHPIATLNQPKNVDRIFWQYQPSGAYPSAIYDKEGWVTVGYRVQNGIDPITNQPCIEEKWYHRAYRYPNYNSPDFDTAVTGTCDTRTVKVSFKDKYQDSLVTVRLSWGGVRQPTHVDSFFREIPEQGTNNLINYRKRYYYDIDTFFLIDSVLTRRINSTGTVLFMDSRDTTIEDKEHTYDLNQGSQLFFRGALDIRSNIINRSGCDLSQIKIFNYGVYFPETFAQNACVGDTVRFSFSPLYNSNIFTFPIGYLDTFQYWQRPQVFSDGITPRPRPKSGKYESLRWDFGDGNGWQSFSSISAQKIYNTAGIYDVKVESTDSFGCVRVFNQKVQITQGVTGFTINDDIQCSDSNNFIVTSPFNSLNDVSNLKWNFGNFVVSNKLADTISLPNPGSYKIGLEATNKLGCKTYTEKQVTVIPKVKPLFSVDSIQRCFPNATFNFNTLSIDTANLKYVWDFGDGTTSTQTNTSHTFPQIGSYPVKLTWDYGECADSTYTCINILDSTNAGFTYQQVGITGNFNFTPLNTNYSTYSWSFGDGSTSNSISPAHLFITPGNFTVTLTVTNSNGCTNTSTQVISFTSSVDDVYANPYIGVSPNPFSNALLLYNKETPISGTLSIKLLDITGKEVLAESFSSEALKANKQLQLSHLSEGIYFLKVLNSSNEVIGLFKLNKINR